MDWWTFGVDSVDTVMLHTFLSAPACTTCTDMVYSKELERDVTTTYSFIEHDRFDFLCPKDE